MLGRSGTRQLVTADLGDFLTLTGQDPVVNAFAEYRARSTSLDGRWLGAEIWGHYEGGALVAACHIGANLVPIGGTAASAVVMAELAATRERSISTIVGRRRLVEAMWDVLEPLWGQPREFRWQQPHLQIAEAPRVEPDPAVRVTTAVDFAAVYPACVAMYTEEVGVSPEAAAGPDMYAARVRQLISRGWSFARIEDGRVVFKAEVACATPQVAQIQGVYVAPDRRGEGLATAGMAAVVQHVRTWIAPVVSLYVNDWNHAARTAYARVGLEETAEFSTIMF